MSTQQKFIVYCAALVAISLFLISFSWNANSFFVGAYRPVVEKSERMKEAANRIQDGDEPDKPSNEPRAIGMREVEIKKERGDRYSTY